MATLIEPDGQTRTVSPEPGGSFDLDDLYRLLGCSMVEAIALADGRVMWLDEEDKLKRPMPPANPTATRFLLDAGGIPWDVVRGSVLICTPEETGDGDRV